jgi:hypothetical protein
MRLADTLRSRVPWLRFSDSFGQSSVTNCVTWPLSLSLVWGIESLFDNLFCALAAWHVGCLDIGRSHFTHGGLDDG